MLSLRPLLALLLVIPAAGCYESFTRPGGPTRPIEVDGGPRPTLPAEYTRGTYEDECGIVPHTTVRLSQDPPSCDGVGAPYLEFDIPGMFAGGAPRTGTVGADVIAQECVEDGRCFVAVEGRVGLAVGVAGLVRFTYDVVLEDGRRLDGETDLDFCGPVGCPPPELISGRIENSCGPDDGPAVAITLTDVPLACDAPITDGVQFAIFGRSIESPGPGFYDLADGGQALGSVCRAGRCTLVREGFVELSDAVPGEIVFGTFVLFDEDGSTFEGAFEVTNWCFGFPGCG